MADFNTLKSFLYETVHRANKTVAELSDETGISTSYLYRACLPIEEKHGSGVKFPVDYLIPLMNATKNYSILNHIAKRCGFLLVKIPRFKNLKLDGIGMLNEYQEATTKAVRDMKEFLDNPNAINFQKVDESLRTVMERSVQSQKYCEKAVVGQIELDLQN